MVLGADAGVNYRTEPVAQRPDQTPVEIQRMFIPPLEVYGSTGGSINEFRQLLSLVASGRVAPVIDSRFTLDTINEAFDRLDSGQQFGKVAITVS